MDNDQNERKVKWDRILCEIHFLNGCALDADIKVRSKFANYFVKELRAVIKPYVFVKSIQTGKDIKVDWNDVTDISIHEWQHIK